MHTLEKWEELERRMQEAGYDQFYGRTGWVRCEPYQYPMDSGLEQVWIWIKTDQGTSVVHLLPGDTVDDLWTRFVKEIEPLRQLSYFSRNRLDQPRTVDYASHPEERPGVSPIGTHALEVVACAGPRVLVDPVLHKAPPGAAYMERFRKLAESRGMRGAKTGLRARLIR